MAKNQEEMHEEVLADGEMRVYELGFHLDPELPSEEVKKAYGEVHDLISSKGTIVAEGEPEKIPLAYTISRQETTGRRDFDSAYFAWIAYEGTVEMHGNTRIIRFIDLLTTKEAAHHASEVRELARQEAAARAVEETEGEDASEAELDAALENAAV